MLTWVKFLGDKATLLGHRWVHRRAPDDVQIGSRRPQDVPGCGLLVNCPNTGVP